MPLTEIMCKPQKMNGWSKDKPEVMKTGFGKIRDKSHADADLNDELNRSK